MSPIESAMRSTSSRRERTDTEAIGREQPGQLPLEALAAAHEPQISLRKIKKLWRNDQEVDVSSSEADTLEQLRQHDVPVEVLFRQVPRRRGMARVVADDDIHCGKRVIFSLEREQPFIGRQERTE